MPAIYISCGGQDSCSRRTARSSQLLADRKIAYEYREVSPRIHSWDFWDEQIRVFLDILEHRAGFTRGVGRRRGKRRALMLKERLRRGKTCTGTFLLFLAGGDVAEFFAGLGFDYLFLDMEHGSFDLARSARPSWRRAPTGWRPSCGCPEVQYHLVTRALDAGAEGIIAPRVESPRQCEDLVRFSRYTPEGERGISTFAGHNRFPRHRRRAGLPGLAQSRHPAGGADRNARRVSSGATRSSRCRASTPAWWAPATWP